MLVDIFHNKNYHVIAHDDLIFLEDRSYMDDYIQIITTILETDDSELIFHISNDVGIKYLILESPTHLGFIAANYRSTTELATSYAHNPKFLTEEELFHLKQVGSGTERDYLLLHLPPSDPVVKAITERLTIPLINGYSIIL